MYRKISVCVGLMTIFLACHVQPEETQKQHDAITDAVASKTVSVTASKEDSMSVDALCTNDSLNAMANIMAGIKDSTYNMYHHIQSSGDFGLFSKHFDDRWHAFDSSRLAYLKWFREKEMTQVIKAQSILFYPFSGPDILYAQTFFPEADQYVMVGLEPVGSLPKFEEQKNDSLGTYFSKINISLHAILKFSFFRTQSMKSDLHHTELDGTLHLLFLFLKRTGHHLCSATPITVDSLGHISMLNSFLTLKKINSPTKGIEIKFINARHEPKTLYYFSLNASDEGLKHNKGFLTYLNGLGSINTYLKGASYLMHKSYFSTIRAIILHQSEQVIQDDSGIALRYFTNSGSKWDYSLYGQYTKPIPMFSGFYQKDLDSLYQQKGTKPSGFGIGYNFKDKNSNFMIATKVH